MSAELLHDIGEFKKLGLSGYDAAYVALARQLKGRWLTFDAKAHQKIKNLKLSELL
jgi:predicted nucleic acid-binding protein